jgi:hypothetical protein
LGGDRGRDAAGHRRLTSRNETAGNGRFQSDNRDVLDQMRDGDSDAWNSVQLRLGERDLE